MSDFQLVDPKGWEYDLQSVYSAYIGYFQLHNVPWYDRTWGHLFSSFDEFLTFSWPAVTVTDTWTGRAHIVTRLNSIGAFLKMIKTRFGETLPQAPNILQITPFETASRHLRHISDHATYRKLHCTLPAVALSAFKARVRKGEPRAVKDLWAKHDRTFIAIDFKGRERNEKSCLEWGYAAVRCGVLDGQGHWPPEPDKNYRKGHYIIGEYVDKVVNKYKPTNPWQYGFGESQVVSKSKLPQIIQAVISSFASPDSESLVNNLVLVTHAASGTELARIEEMGVKLPHNLIVLDIATFERNLFAAGYRANMTDPKTGQPRAPGSILSLDSLLKSFPVALPPIVLHNSGNDAFMCLWSLQMMLEGVEGTPIPSLQRAQKLLVPMATGSLGNLNRRRVSSSGAYDLANEFGRMKLGVPQAVVAGGMPGVSAGRRTSRLMG